MLTNKRRVLIEWGDCDPAGIVFYPRYFQLFDTCTTALFWCAGLPKPEMLKRYNILGLALVDVQAKFIIPSRFGDEVLIETTIIEFRQSSFVISHKLFKAEQLAVECFETRAWIGIHPQDPMSIKAKPIPQEVITLLSRPGRHEEIKLP